MLKTKWFTRLIIAVTFLILLSGCAPGINPAVSGHEQMAAETLFENHALIAITDGDFPSSAKIKNCLSEPVVIKVEVIKDKDAWILIEIPEGEQREMDVAGNVDYRIAIQSATTNDDTYLGMFTGGTKMKIVASDVPFVPIISDDWSCE